MTWVTETEKGRLTCSIISMTFISLNILGPITMRRVEKVNVFIIVTSQELCQEQEHSSEGKRLKNAETRRFRRWGVSRMGLLAGSASS